MSEGARPPGVILRRLTPEDAADYRTIRLMALRLDPDAFSSTYEAEMARPMESFAERLASSVVFAAYDGDRIIGMAGFKQEAGAKHRHKAMLWGMYVATAWRGRGVGAMLVRAVVEAARQQVEQLTLAVVQCNKAAIALYEKFGFRAYGIEPHATKTGDGYWDEVLMALLFNALPGEDKFCDV